MMALAGVSLCTVTLTLVGFWIGSAVHGVTWAALIPTFAGSAGGLGIGLAVLDITRRARLAHSRSEAKLPAPQ